LDPNEIYFELRKRIIHLTLAPESVLNLSDLAKEFNVSRTPIKEVLISLQAGDWVMRQNSHFIVTPLSLERIRETTEIRLVLEVQANIWAMERITPLELDNLNQIREQISAFSENSSNQAFVDHDFTIHRTIYKIAKNIQLATLLERILGHYIRFWLSIPRQIDPKIFFSESLKLIEAIERKDKALIRDCTTRQISNSVAQIMGVKKVL